jgi:hypothetical protein
MHANTLFEKASQHGEATVVSSMQEIYYIWSQIVSEKPKDVNIRNIIKCAWEKYNSHVICLNAEYEMLNK